jgi:hypothetical protein
MKTTKEQFQTFKNTFLRYADLFGLKGYQFYFHHSKLDQSYATISRCEEAKAMVVTLSTELDAVSAKDWMGPESSAKHEAIHALLSQICFIAGARWADYTELDHAEESVVRVLEKAIP